MMSRKFTLREKALLLALTVLLLASGYYLLVFQPSADAISAARNRLADAETLIMVEEVKASQLAQMREELSTLDQASDGKVSEIADYDNTQNVVRTLNAALAGAESYNLVFNAVSVDGQVASRPIDMTFTCPSWSGAKAIIEKLYAAPYRCEITAFTLLSQNSETVGDLTRDPVSVKLTITFFEYVAEAPTEPAQ